jgi:non-ribosomal peptide synthetase component F
VLEHMTSDAERRVEDVSLLSAAERETVLETWNRTAAPFPRELCAHQLFEQQVERTPDATAAVFAGERWSFAELNARANRLAHHLRAMGVSADTRVGLCLERGGDLLVGLLGILKAGGAYMPLDPSYPAQRLAFMLQDAAVAVIVSHSSIADELPTCGEQLVCLDEEEETLARAPDHNPSTTLDPENLAYVIYTSGSTGLPKGVMLPHRGLVNYLAWCTRAYDVASGTGSPVHSSIAFDLTITSLLAPLMVGRPAILIGQADDGLGLADTVRESAELSLLKLTPSHLRLLAQQLEPAEVGVLFEDVFRDYRARVEGREPARVSGPAYRAYIAAVARRDHTADLAWWRHTLPAQLSPTPLPGQRRLTKVLPPDQATRDTQVRLSIASTARLSAFARRQQLTLSTLVQAAWSLVIAASGELEQVLFAAVDAGRPADLPDVQRVVGLCSTLLPVHVRLPREQGLLAWLHELQRAQLERSEHGLIDVARVAETPPWDESSFSSVLVVENFPLEAASDADSALGLDNGSSRLVAHMRALSKLDVRDFVATPMRLTFPLLLTILPQAELLLHAAYQAARFEQPAVTQLLEQLCDVLEQLPSWAEHEAPVRALHLNGSFARGSR